MTPVLHGFGQVRAVNGVGHVQVGNGAGDTDGALGGTCGPAESAGGRLQQVGGSVIQQGELVQIATRQRVVVAALAFLCALTRGTAALANGGAGFTRGRLQQIGGG